MKIFQNSLTKDLRKKSKLQAATDLDELRKAVNSAQTRYEDGMTKTRKRLKSFSETFLYYGNIMDVLANHHPEYVALAWGAMKFLFVVGRLSSMLFCSSLRFIGFHEPRGYSIRPCQGTLQNRRQAASCPACRGHVPHCKHETSSCRIVRLYYQISHPC